MALGRRTKTEHAGAKNGGGYWGHREDAKAVSRKRRRRDDAMTVRRWTFSMWETLPGELLLGRWETFPYVKLGPR